MRKHVDFLVLGSGIAGLTFALKVAKHGKVCIVTKQKKDDTATSYAQGGIAAVMYNPDTFEKHIQDTIIAGDGLCDERIVRLIITESTERVKELIKWGAKFDKTNHREVRPRQGGRPFRIPRPSSQRLHRPRDREHPACSRSLFIRTSKCWKTILPSTSSPSTTWGSRSTGKHP